MTQQGSQVWGSKAINSNDTVINSSNNSFQFAVDGVTYSIVIPDGTYSTKLEFFTSELIVPINTALTNINAPVFVRLGGINRDTHRDVLVIEHKDQTVPHVINNFAGTALSEIYVSTLYSYDPV
jgi:hypothetical protein